MLVTEPNTFKFYHNDETRLYIESAKEKDSSIFRGVYKSFFDLLKKRLLERKKDDSEKRGKEPLNNHNNIFAFIGERGTGKTSCMLSVAKMLEENVDNPVVNRGETSFKVLDSTDPSFFDETTNILDIFLGHLFDDFKTKWEKSNQDDINEKNDLLESFEKVKQTISCMDFKKKSKSNCISSEDNVDKLLNLSASVNLAKDIQDLIQKYLKFVKRDALVIPIDDIDLHSGCAYEMVEQIRKYLIHENVIILMAVKMEQLQKVVEKNFLYEFSELIKQNLLTCEQIIEMANKYLIKLIPEKQRFVLPTIDLMYNRIAVIYEGNEKNESLSGYPVRYIIVKLIFSKTRYLFYHMQGVSSFIIPHTLREYNQLLGLLLGMPDYEKGVLTEQNQRNKAAFRQYFVQSWCKSNLKEEDGLFIKQLFSIEDPSIINKTVVKKLQDRFKEVLNGNTEEVKKIIDEKNKPYNISVGDVNLLLRLVKGAKVEYSEKAFIFAIETFYSMRLYEYYDYRTEWTVEVEGIEKNVRVKNDIDNYSAYEILAGGSFFNLNGENGIFIPVDKDEKRRDYRLYSLKVMKDLLNPLLSKDELSEKEIKIFRMCELFALLTLRRQYKRDRRDEKNKVNSSEYRANIDIVYASKFGINQEFVWFDVMSFFSNLPNVERCYNRIDKRLFIKARENANSLYNCLLKYCNSHRVHAQTDEVHPLLSYSSIRNMEILNDLYNYINENYDVIEYYEDDRESLVEFFGVIQKYLIKSYDEKSETENAKKEWYDIDFSFVTEFINVLKDNDTKDMFNDIFTSAIDMKKQKMKYNISDKVENASEKEVELLDNVISLMDNVQHGNKSGTDDVVKVLGGIIRSYAENQKDKIIQKTEAIDVTPEKGSEQSIDLSKLSSELHSLFKEGESYKSDEVKAKWIELLREKGILDDSVTSWISRKFKDSLMLSYSDIDKSISDFIICMQNRK